MSTCRLCKKQDGRMFKYEVRHYAHAHCALAKWDVKFLDMIPAHEIGNLPYSVLEHYGMLEEAMRRHAKECI